MGEQEHLGGTQVSQWNNSTFNHESVYTRWVTFTLPALSVGTYYLFHGVDALGNVGESREGDTWHEKPSWWR